MKKIIICNIPMRERVEATIYESDDMSLPVSKKPYIYPINSFLSQKMERGDELKVLLLIKKDGNKFYEKNVEYFKNELDEICRIKGSKAEYFFIDSFFSQEKENHDMLMERIVDEIDTESYIMADITFGPKDLPIVVFSALNYAEKFLKCEIGNIVYGQAFFDDNNTITKTLICDMLPLYCLNSLTNTIKCTNPEKAKQMLKSILSL